MDFRASFPKKTPTISSRSISGLVRISTSLTEMSPRIQTSPLASFEMVWPNENINI